jgi:hypothetical protein
VSFVAVALLAIGVTMPLSVRTNPASALTSTTIAIDGQFGDWAGVRADPANVVVDTQIPVDPDWPGQADRDLYYVNATYDDEYLYLCWRRTAGGVKAITFGAYVDLDGDGLLQEDRDVVVAWTVSDPKSEEPAQQNYDEQGRILHYYQARDNQGNVVYPEGDPMDHYGPPPTDQQNPPAPDWPDYRHDVPNGDGNTPDGWALGVPQYGESFPAKTMDAYLDYVSGIECEARVAWSDLGFADTLSSPPPISMHFVCANGEDFGTANKTSLWPDDYKNTNGQLEEENQGQVEDNVKGLYWLLGRSVLVSPDHYLGASADTTVTYAHTIRNGGNADDTYDLALSSSQGWNTAVTTLDGSPVSSLDLAAGESTTVVVAVKVPAGTADGTQDTTTLRATSQADPSISDTASDVTVVGAVVVVPDQSGSMAPGQTITYEHTVTNTQPTGGTFDLTATSSLGWTTSVSDAGGSPLSDVTLASGESTTVVVSVTVPAGATVGLQDVTRLRASLQGDPTTYGEARDTTTVRESLTIEPDRASFSGANATVSYGHTITNSWPSTRTVSLSAVSSEGWPYTFYAADGVTEVTTVDVGPNGGTADIIVRLFVPSGVSYGDVDTTVVTAEAPDGAGSSHADTATDITTIRQLATYDGGGYVNQEDEFVLGDTVYGRAMGLDPKDDVFFVWRDSDGTITRTSPTFRVDTQGMAFDEYETLESDPVGAWSLELYADGDTPGVDAPLETSYFTVSFDAEITALTATDAATVGALTTVNCSTVNNNTATITDSTMNYVIWWDDDGDGVFGAGDIYMDSSGAAQTYSGSGVVSSHLTTGITVAGGATWSDPGWSMSNSQFPNQGTYRVTATWNTSGGTLIDEATTEFYSIPTLGWPLYLIVTFVGVAHLWRRVQSRDTAIVRGVAAA